jgi:hypothetical protein
MFKLAVLLFIMAAPTLAGLLLIAALTMPSIGVAESTMVLAAVIAGAVIAVPVSWKVARDLTRQRRQDLAA